MSLAADILKRAEVGDRPKRQKPPERKKRVLRTDKPPTYRGVFAHWCRGKWYYQPRLTVRGYTEYIGNYGSAERAKVALDLFKHWQKLGYEELPLKPSHKVPYNRF